MVELKPEEMYRLVNASLAPIVTKQQDRDLPESQAWKFAVNALIVYAYAFLSLYQLRHNGSLVKTHEDPTLVPLRNKVEVVTPHAALAIFVVEAHIALLFFGLNEDTRVETVRE